MSQTNYIYSEQLSGTVDGANKVFTSLYPIDRVEDIRIGGADYSDFSFTYGNSTITLADAPTIATGSPYMDYFRSDVDPAPTPVGDKTFLDVITDVYERLGQYTTSLQYPLALVKRYINEGIRVINNVRTNPKYKVGSYSFNKSQDYSITAYDATKLTVGTVSTYTPTSGMVLLGSAEIVTYTGKTSTALTGLSGLEVVYKAGDDIAIGYNIPTGVKKVSEVLYNGRVLDFADRREYISRRGRNVYTIIDGYIFLPLNKASNTDIITVNYVKENTQLVNDSDLIDIENEYYHVLSLYALYNVMMDREDDRYKIQYEKYKDQLRLYKSYLRQVDGINNTVPSNIFEGVSGKYNNPYR